MQPHHPIIIIGAGPAGLSAAETLSAAGLDVIVHDRMPSIARKFLMAGRSGLNLTHAEDLDLFLSRYGTARDWLEPGIRAFPPQALRDWAEALGQPCFAGSSGRVFPEVMKASPLLRAWIGRLQAQGVTFALRSRWSGWGEGASLLFDTPDGPKAVMASAVVLALGGGSWPRLGSDGDWTRVLPGGSVSPLQPANCGFRTGLPDRFHEAFEGEILHSVTLSAQGECARGDITVTRYGIEGAPVYRLSGMIREAVAASGDLVVKLDLRPTLPVEGLIRRLGSSRPRESQSNRLRRLGLAAPARFLLREAGAASLSGSGLAGLIKSCPLVLTGPDSLARAISSAGGVRRAALDERFMLVARPGVFVAGEMLDWEAPTGGYLLQACFATGRAAAEGARQWLAEQATPDTA